MKHLLNNLSEEEKTAIREQHSGGMKIMTENFRKLANSKLGDVRTIVESTIKEDITKEGRNNPLWVNLVSKLKSLPYPPKVITFESYYDEPSVPSQSLNWGTAKDKNGNYGFSIATTDSTQPIERMELFNSNDRKKQMEMHNWWKKNGYSTNGTSIQIKFSDADKLKSDIESFFKIYPPVG
jgi:hypothetical protein